MMGLLCERYVLALRIMYYEYYNTWCNHKVGYDVRYSYFWGEQMRSTWLAVGVWKMIHKLYVFNFKNLFLQKLKQDDRDLTSEKAFIRSSNFKIVAYTYQTDLVNNHGLCVIRNRCSNVGKYIWLIQERNSTLETGTLVW